MKRFFLAFLMFINIGLQAGIPHGNPAAAQHYANTAQGQINSYQTSLETDYETLRNLMSNMETAMCGINADNGGLVINTSGSGSSATYNYSNCTGGAMGYFNSWNNHVSYWSNVISNATSSSAWTTAYDACIATYAAPEGYNTDVYSDLGSASVVGYVNNMWQSMNAIMGCTHNASPATPYSATNPDPCPNDLPNNLLTVANTDSTKGPIGLIQNMITTMDNLSNAINLPGLLAQGQTINNTWSQYNAAVNAYTNCFKNNNQSWSALKTCATDFENYLNAYETEVNAIIALFEALLPLLPDVTGTYTLMAEPASIVCALAPQKCIVPNPACNTCVTDGTCNTSPCQYSVENFNNFDINGNLQKIAAYVQSAANTVKYYNSQVNVMQNRLKALVNQLQTLNTNIANVQVQIKQINTNCQNDIYEYEAHQSNTVFDIIDSIVGLIISIPVFSFLGGLGGPALEIFAMVLLQIDPTLNNDTLGLASSIITQGIVQAT